MAPGRPSCSRPRAACSWPGSTRSPQPGLPAVAPSPEPGRITRWRSPRACPDRIALAWKLTTLSGPRGAPASASPAPTRRSAAWPGPTPTAAREQRLAAPQIAADRIPEAITFAQVSAGLSAATGSRIEFTDIPGRRPSRPGSVAVPARVRCRAGRADLRTTAAGTRTWRVNGGRVEALTGRGRATSRPARATTRACSAPAVAIPGRNTVTRDANKALIREVFEKVMPAGDRAACATWSPRTGSTTIRYPDGRPASRAPSMSCPRCTVPTPICASPSTT